VLEAAIDKFLEYLTVIKNASPHTIRNYSIDLKLLNEYLCKNTSSAIKLSTIDRRNIRGFLAHLTAARLNKKTIGRRLSSLRTFFKFAYEQKLIPADPSEALDTPKIEKKIPNYLTYDHMKKLFEMPDISSLLGVRDRAMMELFYSSGLRVSELVAMNRQDFDRKALLIKVKGKGKKERIVPITQTAAHWITSYLENPERYLDVKSHRAEIDPQAIFLNKWGERLSARSVDRNFALYLKRSGLAGKTTPHTIRHTIATHWLENGMDLKTIQLMLGHSSLAATTIYTKVSSNLKQKVYNIAHPRAKKRRCCIDHQRATHRLCGD
jgi:integrase/recombinase XerC